MIFSSNILRHGKGRSSLTASALDQLAPVWRRPARPMFHWYEYKENGCQRQTTRKAPVHHRHSIRHAPCATFGTSELSQDAVKALEDRLAFPVGASWVDMVRLMHEPRG
jgi:hypothetical protein